ncbi:MAG: hypothetical protein Q9219_001542 [cf. Caloplaca sp. 3 TL-2023]
MPRTTSGPRKKKADLSWFELDGLQPVCDGPKLHPFSRRKSPIQYIRQLGDPKRDGQGYIFEVKIAGKPYALKIFKFYDDESDVDAISASDLDRLGLDTFHAQLDPFYNECRAYGKLIESNRNGLLAVRCHGYTTIHNKEVYRLGEKFHIRDIEQDAESFGWYGVPPERQLYRAIVKDLIREDRPLTHKRIKKMLRDLLAMRKLGIYAMDLKSSNYRDAVLVDFSAAVTEPHHTFEISAEWQNKLTRDTDLIEFDEMVEKAKVKTWVKAWTNAYKEKLRPRDPARKKYPR